jgi:phosphatidylserine/phosphatidylglycerophosphate/cardiolipin synthase-like enzyme
MYPEDDISHGVCFRPAYNDANKRYEYACAKFVHLFAFLAKESIKISTFQFTQESLLYSLVAAQVYNNVNVEMVANPGQMSRYTTFAKAHECGVKIYINCMIKNPVLHHDKFLIFDDKVLITGSYNLSANSNNNFENYVVISNAPVIESYKKRFDSIKNLASPYNPPVSGDYADSCMR